MCCLAGWVGGSVDGNGCKDTGGNVDSTRLLNFQFVGDGFVAGDVSFWMPALVFVIHA